MSNMYDPKFGLSVSYQANATPEEYVGRLKRFGFTAAELNIPYIEKHADGISLFRDELRRLSCHLPHDRPHKALASDPAEDARVLERQKRNIELAASVGCRTFVFHLGNVVGQRLEDYWERSVVFARRLGELARQVDSVVGVENCLPVVGRAEVARRFLDAVDHENLGMTLDTGHFWSILQENDVGRHKENPLKCTDEGNRLLNTMCTDMARTVNTKIFNIHIHNLRYEDWKDHQPVDHGVMQYDDLFAVLEQQNYDRAVIIEIGSDGDWSGFESSAAYLQRFA
ncbi:MAG: hypothetical protein AMS16_04800 [Planctomycetes bacterium DG_58]|nr:MAG: hypothetical protein AMS16_04800 [Planctomycetes bacterium DG_58]